MDKGRFEVIFTDAARRALNLIWTWNDEQYGPDRADRYVDFLMTQTLAIGDDPESGRPIPNRENMRFVVIRRKSRGHGHVAIYRVRGGMVEVFAY